jgi:hemerythrin
MRPGAARKRTPALPVGIAEIDEQHRELFVMSEKFARSIRGKGRLEMDALLESLERCAHEHFQLEERLMRQHAFPGLIDHHREHRHFVRTLRQLISASSQEEVATAIEKFLREWLHHHMGVTDVRLGRFLRRQRTDAPR